MYGLFGEAFGAGGRRRSDILQIMNRPLRYLSRDVLDEPQVDLDCWEAVYEEQPWIARRIAQLAEDFQIMSHMGPFAAMNYVRKGIGYEEFVADYARSHGQKEQELVEVLEELHVADACVRVVDRGALDCVIRARVETAVRRGRGEC